MLFMSDLPASELVHMGHGFFKEENEKMVNKSIIDGTGVVKEIKYSMTNDADSK